MAIYGDLKVHYTDTLGEAMEDIDDHVMFLHHSASVVVHNRFDDPVAVHKQQKHAR